MKNQKLRYEYPFTDEGFGMDVDLGFIVCGIGKSLLPVSFCLSGFFRPTRRKFVVEKLKMNDLAF